jgi:hypothetical protein
VLAAIIGGAVPVNVAAIGAVHALSPEEVDRIGRVAAGFSKNVRVKPGWRAEIAFAYDPDTDRGRELPTKGHRDYGAAGPNEFAGTVDVVSMDLDLVEITDWKFGRRENVKVPGSNAQLRFLALAAARTYDVDRARVRIGFVDDDGGVLFESSDLDAFELDAIAAEMADLAARLRAPGAPEPEQLCKRCPAVTSCPATAKTIVDMVPASDAAAFPIVADPAAIAGPDHAAWLLHRARAVQKAAELVVNALEVYADKNGGIPVAPGIVWAGRDIKIERIESTPEAEALVKEVLPEAVKSAITKKSIEDAARARKLPIAQTSQTVLARLKVAGCIKTSVQRRYEER